MTEAAMIPGATRRALLAAGAIPSMALPAAASAGQDASWQNFGVVPDQRAALADDVHRVTSHPLIPESVAVGGFLYDVDTGLLDRVV